jgi:hypothetical protein
VKNNEFRDTRKLLTRSQSGDEAGTSRSSGYTAKKNQLEMDLIKYEHKK